MSKVIAVITTSVDGYVAAPHDEPGRGLGEGGEAIHAWVFGGTWRYDDSARGEMDPQDKAWFAAVNEGIGAVVCGRYTYEAAGHWGDRNPFGAPAFVVTHRPEEEPPTGEFTFVTGVPEAVARAGEAAGAKNVHVMGGADVIRQALAAGLVDELTLIIAPLVLGGGKRLFDGFDRRLELEQLSARQSRFATFIEYRVG
jgi:dihydrofolate reductase